MKFTVKILLSVVMVIQLSGCASKLPGNNPTTNPYTSGQVSLTLKKGITTQAEVARVFGAPNIVQQNTKGSVWIYQKNAEVSRSASNSSYFTILLMGSQSNNSGFEQSSKTMTLIIHFNKKGIVTNFKSLTTSF